MLFNIFINDLFLIKLNSEICNFADDKRLYSCGKDLNEIVTNLEIDLRSLLTWFAKNGMVANPTKFQLMFLGLKAHRPAHTDGDSRHNAHKPCAEMILVLVFYLNLSIDKSSVAMRLNAIWERRH